MKQWARLNRWLKKQSPLLSAWASLVAIVGVPLLFLGGVATYIQLAVYFHRPDVVLEFAGVKDPRFWVVNTSTTLSREAQYSLGLWDLTARFAGGTGDPGNLMIPVTTMEFIRPRSARGPWTIDSVARSGAPIPVGHVVFGWAMVHCPDCISRHDYWVYLVKGQTAWYAEIEQRSGGNVLESLSAVLRAGSDFQATIDRLVPADRRRQFHE